MPNRALLITFLLLAVTALAMGGRAYVQFGDDARAANRRFANEIPQTIRADHPAIVPIAAAIRLLTSDTTQQVALVEVAENSLIELETPPRLYGREFIPTLDEMLENRRANHWVYARECCTGRAVFAAHVLETLGIPWRLRNSTYLGHAWCEAKVDGAWLAVGGASGVPQTFLALRLVWPVLGAHSPTLSRSVLAALGRDALAMRVLGVTWPSLSSSLGSVHPNWDEVPGSESPAETRSAPFAGFPYGEEI